MRNKIQSVLFLLVLLTINSVPAFAAEENGRVSVEDSGTSGIIDPENPQNIVNPGQGPSTTGALRIDYISSLNFGSEDLNAKDRKFNSLAQLFLDDTSARGYYIQVSDFRPDDGWQLQLTQKNQFHNSIIQDLSNQELKGAVLSFDNGWANTNGTGQTPLVTRDSVSVDAFNTAYTIASAGKNEGKGSWTIAFGASKENKQGQKPTLTPLKDAKGNQLINEAYNKPQFKNSAISLTIPKETKIYPVEYSTTLTWTLLAGPT